MSPDDIRQTLESFLSLFEAEQPQDPHEAKLRLCLDQLALAQHFVADVEPKMEEPPPPRPDESEQMERFCSLYPELSPDALLHLVEVVGDLEDVLWRWDRYGAPDGLWHFRFLFEAHWGEHLRALQLWLHERHFCQAPAGTEPC